MAINISTDIAVTTGGKLTDIGAIQGGWKSVSTYSDMAALTGSATLKGKLQNGQVFYVVADKELYSLSITGNVPFQTYSFTQFEFPMTSSVGSSTDISALNTFTGSIQSEVDSLTSATSSYILVSDTSSMFVSSSIIADTASFVDPTFISASAAASGFGSGEGTHTDITNLNIFTGSIQSEVDSLTSATSSYALIADISGAFSLDSSSFETRLTSLENFAGGGDITSVIAGAGLSGGSETGDATITLDTSSTHFTSGVSASAAASGFGAGGGTNDFTQLTNVPSGLVSGSTQITDVVTDSYISASAAASGFGAGGGIFTATGSVYSTTNDLEVTGSFTVADGVLRLSELTTTPEIVDGGMFYSASNFYFGMP